jgi:uncharacterized protein
MHLRVNRVGVWLAAIIALFGTALWAADILPPAPKRYFNDYASLIDSATASRLNARLEGFERESSNQLVVAIFPKLPENTFLEDFTVKTAQAWGVGGKQRDNGIVLFVFAADRKLRIEVGYGLEGRIPDSVAAAIIREDIRPAFKTGNYAAGLERGVEALISAAKGEYQGTGKTVADASTAQHNLPFWPFVLGFILFVIWIHLGDTVFQRGGRFMFYNLLDLLRVALLTSGSSGGGSGSSWSGGSSGGFSGGGGSFGGGGASGDW